MLDARSGDARGRRSLAGHRLEFGAEDSADDAGRAGDPDPARRRVALDDRQAGSLQRLRDEGDVFGVGAVVSDVRGGIDGAGGDRVEIDGILATEDDRGLDRLVAREGVAAGWTPGAAGRSLPARGTRSRLSWGWVGSLMAPVYSAPPTSRAKSPLSPRLGPITGTWATRA
ncbi:hypothetical protein GCM10025867_40990 [Frondihabitans sucicola]|uniref:Uncharacterized protein n=1 Tax=Frondihabitans sucicola TaxID=1268041 RepID=A0ABM8GTS8_9MICO|nr:hypothetical protein GCM10025867_40990 [Frondihabitans sucicola]